jgi:alpha-L-fucosidase
MLSLASLIATIGLSLIAPPNAALATTASAEVADAAPISLLPETKEERDERMRWWRESRFGMFIHWGLYAIPAGEWEGKNVSGAGEWIINTAHIKVADYQPLITQFNPVKFDAKQWVSIAKNAGMRYIVITSKHHEGFGLWDSALTDWDIGGTPFKRDILKELADACQAEGIRLCFYHSIMDWTHPDYLPRRAWDPRPEVKADFERYRAFMKGQLKELLSGTYGDIGVLWFDGEWESTWTHEFGKDLDDYVRSLKKDIIINNRVDVGREGMIGFSKNPEYRGDFGTPEQQIPATGVPGADWETCMTMNDTWGFHKNDHNWKSNETLIRMVSDIASKGGNFLLNVGPTALGEIPPESVERLAAVGAWMKTNGEAIHATQASPFAGLTWGRATMRAVPGGTKLYLHVFDWPANGTLTVPGLMNTVKSAMILGGSAVTSESKDGELTLTLPKIAPDPIATVIALELEGEPQIVKPVQLLPERSVFVGAVQVSAGAMPPGVTVRYTTNGQEPTLESKELTAIALRGTATVRARAFLNGKPIGPVVQKKYESVPVWSNFPDRSGESTMPIHVMVQGEFNSVADLRAKLPAVSTWTKDARRPIGMPERSGENFGVAFRGMLRVPYEGLWLFRLGSDDGSVLEIDQKLVVDNDGLHSYKEVEGHAPLTRGLHLIEVFAFNRSGQSDLKLLWNGPGITWQPIQPSDFLAVPGR